MATRVISELATPAEVAAELRVDTAVVKRWLRAGRLPGFRTPGGAWRIEWADVGALKPQRDRHGRNAARMR